MFHGVVGTSRLILEVLKNMHDLPELLTVYIFPGFILRYLNKVIPSGSLPVVRAIYRSSSECKSTKALHILFSLLLTAKTERQ